MISGFLYYIFFASAVLVYGIGIERSITLSRKRRHLILKAAKMIICVSSTCALSYLFVNNLLVPADLGELYPFVVFLIFTAISVFTEAIIRITTKISAAEYGVTLLFIFLSLSESVSLADCVFISCICVLSFFIFIPVLYSICHRIELNGNKMEYEKTGFILVSIAIILLVFLSWNVSWINKGVFQW